MVAHRLHVPEAPFERVRRPEGGRPGDPARELDGTNRAAHGVGTRHQELTLLLQRVGLARDTPPIRLPQRVEQQQTTRTQDRFRPSQIDLGRRALPEQALRRDRRLVQRERGHLVEGPAGHAEHRCGDPRPGRAHDRESVQRPPVVRSRLELRLHRERQVTGHEDVGDRDVVAPRAPHPHDVPGVDDLAPLPREVHHPHLGLIVGVGVGVHEDGRRDPVGVVAVAHERRTARDAVAAVDGDRLERPAELGGDQHVGTAAVDLLGSLVGEAGTEEGPVQRVLQGPGRGGVVATDLLADQRPRDRVGLQAAQRAGCGHAQQPGLPQCVEHGLRQASLPLGLGTVLPDDRCDVAGGVEQRGVDRGRRCGGGWGRESVGHDAHASFAGSMFWLTWKMLSGS